jgi:hypothetical protein
MPMRVVIEGQPTNPATLVQKTNAPTWLDLVGLRAITQLDMTAA